MEKQNCKDCGKELVNSEYCNSCGVFQKEKLGKLNYLIAAVVLISCTAISGYHFYLYKQIGLANKVYGIWSTVSPKKLSESIFNGAYLEITPNYFHFEGNTQKCKPRSSNGGRNTILVNVCDEELEFLFTEPGEAKISMKGMNSKVYHKIYDYRKDK